MTSASDHMIDAANGIADVIDFLQVLEMALCYEDGDDTYSAMATVCVAARLKAEAAREAAKRAQEARR